MIQTTGFRDNLWIDMPWTVSLNQEIMLDTELIDEICRENEKSWQHMQAPQPPK